MIESSKVAIARERLARIDPSRRRQVAIIGGEFVLDDKRFPFADHFGERDFTHGFRIGDEFRLVLELSVVSDWQPQAKSRVSAARNGTQAMNAISDLTLEEVMALLSERVGLVAPVSFNGNGNGAVSQNGHAEAHAQAVTTTIPDELPAPINVRGGSPPRGYVRRCVIALQVDISRGVAVEARRVLRFLRGRFPGASSEGSMQVTLADMRNQGKFPISFTDAVRELKALLAEDGLALPGSLSPPVERAAEDSAPPSASIPVPVPEPTPPPSDPTPSAQPASSVPAADGDLVTELRKEIRRLGAKVSEADEQNRLEVGFREEAEQKQRRAEFERDKAKEEVARLKLELDGQRDRFRQRLLAVAREYEGLGEAGASPARSRR